MTLAEEAAKLYEAGVDEQVIELAVRHWPSSASEGLSDLGLAELCRFARICAVRLDRSAAAEIWGARALAAGFLERNPHTMAGLLLRPFFALIEAGDFSEARDVLEEVRRLVREDFDGYGEARENYNLALEFAFSQRAKLKVRGAITLASYLAGSTRAEEAHKEMLRLQDEAARTNAELIVGGSQRNWTAFEVL